MINIICSGKIKEKYLEDLICDYKTRISKYHKINIIEVKDENNLVNEAKNIMKLIKKDDFVIACAINGRFIDSVEFARLIESTFISYGTIDFVIGSSIGLDESVYNRANEIVSFSKVTMPHGLFRGVLLEQIYRAFKINNGESYHK